MKILLIGKNSFIGNAFIKRYRLNYDIYEKDIKNNPIADEDFKRIDVVVHLAAIVHVNSKINPQKYFEVNSDLAYSVALKSKLNGVKQFIFFSSVKVYGEKNEVSKPWNESSSLKPGTHYGQSKKDAEKRILQLADNEFNVTILRPCLVYGPNVKANMYNLIRLVDRYPILPFKNINNKRSLVFVENLLELLGFLINNQIGGIFIASDNSALSTTALVNCIAKSLNKKRVLINMPIFFKFLMKKVKPEFYNGLWGTFYVETNTSYRSIGFSPRFSIEQGILEMVNWYKSSSI